MATITSTLKLIDALGQQTAANSITPSSLATILRAIAQLLASFIANTEYKSTDDLAADIAAIVQQQLEPETTARQEADTTLQENIDKKLDASAEYVEEITAGDYGNNKGIGFVRKLHNKEREVFATFSPGTGIKRTNGVRSSIWAVDTSVIPTIESMNSALAKKQDKISLFIKDFCSPASVVNPGAKYNFLQLKYDTNTTTSKGNNIFGIDGTLILVSTTSGGNTFPLLSVNVESVTADVKTLIENETSERTKQDANQTKLYAALTQLVSALDTKVSANATAISDEATTRFNKDAETLQSATTLANTVQSNLDAVEKALKAEDDNIEDMLAEEESLRQKADEEENARAKAAEEANATAISNETTRAKTAEQTLQSNIDKKQDKLSYYSEQSSTSGSPIVAIEVKEGGVALNVGNAQVYVISEKDDEGNLQESAVLSAGQTTLTVNNGGVYNGTVKVIDESTTGLLSDLTTTSKGTLVAAINELVARVVTLESKVAALEAAQSEQSA